MNYLGIDYGEHRVGIAFAESQMRWAFPRETIDQKVRNLMNRLEEIVKKEKVDIFVVGMPMHPDGRQDGKNRVVEQFIDDLRTHFPKIAIEIQDESYTSVVALQQTSYLSKKKKQKDKGIVDRAAAALILQAWLDKT